MSTVGELMAEGLTHVRVHCHGVVLCVPWGLLGAAAAPEMPFARLVARLRCSACGEQPEPASIRPWGQHMASGYAAG